MNLSLRGFPRTLNRTLHLLLLSMAGGLAACSGAVGSGNAPVSMIIAAPGGTTELPTLHMYECLTSGLRAVLSFTDHSEGDFTARVVWSSSNPGAVEVSNGDVPAPGGFYANGVLVPRGPGNAIITADYFGIRAQTAVSVGTPESIKVKAVVQNAYLPLGRINLNRTTDSSTFTLGSGTTQIIAATALLDGVETDVSRFADFEFDVPNAGVATINQATQLTSATINAVNAGGPLVPVVRFAPCSLTNITDPSQKVSFTVKPVQRIHLQPEFPPPDPSQPVSDSNPLPQLIVGNTERFRVVAELANGDEQDVSPQSTLTTTNAPVAAFGTVGANNILSALTPGGPVILSATFSGGGAALTAPSLVTSARQLTLSTFSTCWSDQFTVLQSCPANQPVPMAQAGSLTPVEFHAFGFYGFDGANNPIIQDVTRQTTWFSTNTGVATISNTANNSGQALGIAQGSVTIQATNAAAANVPQVFSQLVVNGIQQ